MSAAHLVMGGGNSLSDMTISRQGKTSIRWRGKSAIGNYRKEWGWVDFPCCTPR